MTLRTFLKITQLKYFTSKDKELENITYTASTKYYKYIQDTMYPIHKFFDIK